MASPPDSPLILPEGKSPGIVDTGTSKFKVRIYLLYLLLPTDFSVRENW